MICGMMGEIYRGDAVIQRFIQCPMQYFKKIMICGMMGEIYRGDAVIQRLYGGNALHKNHFTRRAYPKGTPTRLFYFLTILFFYYFTY